MCTIYKEPLDETDYTQFEFSIVKPVRVEDKKSQTIGDIDSIRYE